MSDQIQAQKTVLCDQRTNHPEVNSEDQLMDQLCSCNGKIPNITHWPFLFFFWVLCDLHRNFASSPAHPFYVGDALMSLMLALLCTLRGRGDFVAALQPIHKLYGTPHFSILAPIAFTVKAEND